MEKVRNSAFLKILSYALIPILVATFILSILYLNLKENYEGDIGTQKEQYVQSEVFADQYVSSIIYNINRIKLGHVSIEDNGIYDKIDENIYYDRAYNYYNDIESFIKYIIVDNVSNVIYTNIQSNNFEEEIKHFTEKEFYWNYENGTIQTNITKVNQDNIKYMNLPIQGLETLSGFNVYTYLDLNAFQYSSTYAIQLALFGAFDRNPNLAEVLIPVSVVLLVIIISYLLWAIGHSKGKGGITLNSIDRIPYEILVTIFGIILFSICVIIAEVMMMYASISVNLLLSTLFLSYIGAYICLAIIVVSTIKRLKAKQFWRSFLVYKIYKKIKNAITKRANKVLDKSDSQKKIIIGYIAFIFVSSILGFTFFTGISCILLIALWIFVLYKLLEYNKKLNQIKSALREIYNGNNNVYLDTETLRGTLKELATYVNDVSNGFSNAVQESLKSERLRTELITNVSHDIKTPLTSIINYVDLIKREDIQDEKINEYVKVLDQKSQRLKKLIDDLVEASKASSGNVKLNIEEMNLDELLKQVIGEFEDKFEEKNLSVDLNLPGENVKIFADNRYMYRIIENLFSNISKYSMENTRVYIDLINTRDAIKLEIKNVSKERLNISADELMQRFVRGDKSRYTEGSGLGLSIAESLAGLQNIEFKIEIDGDLFKTILQWDK